MMQPIDDEYWNSLIPEWHERSTDTIREKLVNSELIQENSLDSPYEQLNSAAIWLKAFETDGWATLLAYLVFMLGMETWEFTSNHNDVRANAAGARTGYLRAYREAKQIVDAHHSTTTEQRENLRRYFDQEQKLVYLIFNSFTIPVDLERVEDEKPVEVAGTLLLDAMSVESAVYSASTAATEKRANDIKVLSENLRKDRLINDQGSSHGVRVLLCEILKAHTEYYGCIAQIAGALHHAARADPVAISRLDTALDGLAKAQNELTSDVYATELPAYRVALRAWRDRLTQPAPQVLLDSANITYIYPFALTDVDGKRAQEIALTWDKAPTTGRSDFRWGLDPIFGGRSALKANELQLTDMWTWGGRGKKLNGTVRLPMPPLTVGLEDDSHAKCTYSVELRFNEPGNHYLRVDLELDSADLKSESSDHKTENYLTFNNVGQALRRATTYGGDHFIDKRWATVADYARDVIADVTSWITAKQKYETSRQYIERSNPEQQNEKNFRSAGDVESQHKYHFNPDFDYHVIVVIHRASVRRPDGSRREATKEDIERAYGPLLLQVLNREPTTLDEWICWGGPQITPNLLGDASFPPDFAIGTESTTVLYMPSTPSWARSGYEEVAEFAASFPPVIYQKRTNLDAQLERAEKLIRQDDDGHIDQQEAELDQMRTDLHNALEDIRNVRTYLVPSQLLSLRAEGTFLDHLYRQSRLPELRAEIETYLDRGHSTINRMNIRENRLHDYRNRNYQDVIQNILLLVGIFSLSGVATLLLTVYYGTEVPGKNTKIEPSLRPFPWNELIFVVALYSVVVGIVWLVFRKARKNRIGARNKTRARARRLRVRIVDATKLSRADLEAFYDQILAPSFDSAELVERTELIDALADSESNTHCQIAFDQAGQIVGGIIGDWFAGSRVMLTSYLAARPGLRGHGVGKRLLAKALPAWRSKVGALLVVAEVENPRLYPADEDHGDPYARLRFYARSGAKILDIPYFQPALSTQQPRVRNLFLMVLTSDQSVVRDHDRIAAATVEGFIEENLASSEGDVDDHDDEVRALRAALHANDAIPLLDPAELLKGE